MALLRRSKFSCWCGRDDEWSDERHTLVYGLYPQHTAMRSSFNMGYASARGVLLVVASRSRQQFHWRATGFYEGDAEVVHSDYLLSALIGSFRPCTQIARHACVKRMHMIIVYALLLDIGVLFTPFMLDDLGHTQQAGICSAIRRALRTVSMATTSRAGRCAFNILAG